MENRLIYSIGDIHGCFNALIKLLEEIEKDRAGAPALIVFLGDYTDRGPDSAKVVDHLTSLSSSKGDVEYVFIRGNHDQMLMDYVKHPESDAYIWIANGGGATLNSFNAEGLNLDSYLPKFFNKTKLYYQERDFVFVHAGLDPNHSLKNQTDNFLLWERKMNNYNGEYFDNVFVVHGHTPVETPYFRKNSLNIDTGCVFQKNYPEHNKGLTAVKILDRKNFKFISVSEFTGHVLEYTMQGIFTGY